MEDNEITGKFHLPRPPKVQERPYVIVNCAASADGKIALPDGRQTRISSDDDMVIVHKLRNWADAVVVGISTILTDDPKLNVKEKYVTEPKQPLRVVVDSCCRTPSGSMVVNDMAETLIACSSDHWPQQTETEIIECGDGKQVNLAEMVNTLWKRGVRKIMVEGGGTLIASFAKAGLVDEFMIFFGDMLIGGKESPTLMRGEGARELREIVNLKRYAVIPMEKGIRVHYLVEKDDFGF